MRKLRLIIAITLMTVTLMGWLGSDQMAVQAKAFPNLIPLPNGFQPEGVATGRGTDLFVGSLGSLDANGNPNPGGAIYKADLRSGQGALLVNPREGRMAVGLAVDQRTNYLFVAGGIFGTAYVYDGNTGEDVATYQLTEQVFPFTVVNDAIVTRDAVYFTDSFRNFFYRLPLGPGGSLPDSPTDIEEIPLTGDLADDFMPGGINANGIDATPDGKWLIIGHTDLGALYRVDPRTGASTQIDLGGDSVLSADGLLLNGRTLYIAQATENEIGVVELAPDLSSGQVQTAITNPDFRVPTTVAGFGAAVYAVNARFDVAPPPLPGSPPADPNLAYEVVRVPKH